ncbi:hypothetical protein [Methylocystis sp. S23]
MCSFWVNKARIGGDFVAWKLNSPARRGLVRLKPRGASSFGRARGGFNTLSARHSFEGALSQARLDRFGADREWGRDAARPRPGRPIALRETAHFKLLREFCADPESFVKATLET